MDWMILLALLIACAAAASTGAAFPPGIWYRELAKPRWTPPDWLFPVAWTVLYLAMAVAGWRAALSGHAMAPLFLALWAAQIALNAVWTPVFFGLHRLRGALAIIAALWVCVLGCVITGFMIAPPVGWLLVPYLVWVGYAAALNLSIARRNGGVAP